MQILNKPVLATVSTSGQYADLTGKPTALEPKLGAYNSLVLNGVSGTDELVTGGNVIIKSGTGGTDSTLLGSVVLQNGINTFSFTGTNLVFPDTTELNGSEITLPENTDFRVSTTRVNEFTTNSFSLTFDRQGVLGLPGNGTIVTGDGVWALDSANKELSFPNDFRIQYGAGFGLAEQDVRLQSSGVVKVQAGPIEWVFSTTGVLTLPLVGDIQDNAGRSLLGGGVSAQVLVTSGSRDLVITDVGKHIYISGEEYIWVPHNSEVNFPIGSTITVVSKEAPITIQNSSSQLLNYVILHVSGNPGTGQGYSAVFIPAYSVATLLKVAANTWMVSGTGLSV
jgi:hypothetical protein